MGKIRLVLAVIAVGLAVAGLFAAGAIARLDRSAAGARRAVVSGWIIFAGGPPDVGTAVRRRSGTVVVRTASGRIVARARASAKHGFRLSLPPGRYELSAIVPIRSNGHPVLEENCPPETKVKIHSGKNVPIYIYVGCETP